MGKMSGRNKCACLFTICLLAALVVIYGTSSVMAAEISQTYSFNRPSLQSVTIDGIAYDRISMPDVPNDGEAGLPSLPSVGSKILLPYQSKIEYIEVIPGDRVSLGSGYHIEPAQYHVPLSADFGSIKAALPNPSVYEISAFYPAEDFQYAGTFSFRGYDFAVVKLLPAEYNPVTGELFYYTEITVRVYTIDAKEEPELFRGLTKDAVEANSKVDNADAVESYLTANKNGLENYDLLIITTDAFKASFEPLKNYHNSTGILTEIHTISEVGSNDPATVRDYIRQAYLNDGISYVLIGGDDEFIPARDLYANFRSSSGLEEDATIPADLYFGCLDGTFDYTGNGIYGEYGDGDNGESVDLVAEVYVGRASVSNTVEAQRFVSKTIRYLTHQATYLKNLLLVGEQLGFGGISDYAAASIDQLMDVCEDDGYMTSGLPSSLYTPDRLYDRDWGGNYWPNAELFDRINSGVHMVHHLGHCNSSWAMKSSSTEAVEKMHNTELFFLYSQGCMPGAFDWGDCWAEHAHLKTDNGPFAIIMNARFGLGRGYSTDGVSNRYHRQFVDAIYNPDENKPELGRANADSKEDNLHQAASGGMRWVYYEINLFGDPTITLWKKWLGLYSFEFSDIQGDNDGILEAGETIELVCELENTGIPQADNITMELTINDQTISVISGSAAISSIMEGETAANTSLPFSFTLPVDYITRVDTFLVDVSWSEGGEQKSTVLSFTAPMGAIPILVVDGYENDSIERYYFEYLNNANLPYKIWETDFSTGPSAADLNKYEIVVWLTGGLHSNPLSPSDITALKGFLDNGGKLFLSGQGIAANVNITDQEFLHNYLKSEYESAQLSPLLCSQPDGIVLPVSDTLFIQGSSGADNQTFPDRIYPINGGIGELRWLGSTTYGAVTYGGDYKLVYFSFGWEAITRGDARFTDRDTVFASILEFFNLEHADGPPEITSMSMTPDNFTHLMNHTPEFSWSYSDNNGHAQTHFQIQVGADYYWSPDDMWDSGPVAGGGSSIVYAGSPLIDGQDYCIRIRAQNGELWSDWEHFVIHLNSIPIPQGLIPCDLEIAYLGHIKLEHDEAEDIEGDNITYSYELYEDEAMTILVEQIDNVPSGSSDKAGWVILSNLTEGDDYYWRVKTTDDLETGEWSSLEAFIVGPAYVCGDSNGDGIVNVGDAVSTINFVFKGGPAPNPLNAGDSNCDETCNVGDAVYTISYAFRGGPAPCENCPD